MRSIIQIFRRPPTQARSAHRVRPSCFRCELHHNNNKRQVAQGRTARESKHERVSFVYGSFKIQEQTTLRGSTMCATSGGCPATTCIRLTVSIQHERPAMPNPWFKRRYTLGEDNGSMCVSAPFDAAPENCVRKKVLAKHKSLR